MDDSQKAFLDGPHLAVLATIGPSGAPHGAPMWYLRDGDDLLMLTTRTSQKAVNIGRDPRASVVVDVRERPYRALMLSCVAETTDLVPDEVRAVMARRYLPDEEAAAYVESRRGADSVVIRLSPGATTGYP